MRGSGRRRHLRRRDAAVTPPAPPVSAPGAAPLATDPDGAGSPAGRGSAGASGRAARSAMPGPTIVVRTATASTSGAPIRTEWPRDGLPLLWKHPIGPGYASFVAAERPCLHDRTAEAAGSRGGLRHGDRARGVDQRLGRGVCRGPRRTRSARDADVPRRRWSTRLERRASCERSTRRRGAVRWRRNILADNRAANLDWGASGAPLIVGRRPWSCCRAAAAAVRWSLTTRARATRLWHSLDDRQAYTSPMLVTLAGERQITFDHRHARGGHRGGRTAGCSGSFRGRPARASTPRSP